ncbi:SHOCT domain-containing protein [Streptomyces sp. JJ38]|uniref:SHOCT domain-containing protein n=1 Tax=Streptomyces sp. JJ38 TaxID=2738128 RepID=UPI001C5805E1|nr:SHOCT domain-containing protein [Streptomyces sp. JJ38]MBW1600125.1 SHOCT domain-containing protein [Streptomyces sp. JJ38]
MDTVQMAYDFPLLSALLTTAWIFLWVIWVMLLFWVIADVIRDHDLSGGAKAGWLLLVLVLPFLGVFVYLVSRGKGMAHREAARQRSAQADVEAYIRETAGGGGPSRADELAKLSDLRTRGEITDDEFRRAKEKILG